MMPSSEPTIDEQVEHLEQGRAFVDRSAFRTVAVAGAGAIAWLHDLATANVAALGISEECRSLLLTPTGRIRADFQILRTGEESLLLVQDPAQPRGVEGILAPYVLSSEIEFRSAGDPRNSSGLSTSGSQ